MPLPGFVTISNPVSMLLAEQDGDLVPEDFQILDAFFLLKDIDPVVSSGTRVKFTIPASVAPDELSGLQLHVLGSGFVSSGGTITGDVTGFELRRGSSVFLKVSQLDMDYATFDGWYNSVIDALPPAYLGLRPDNNNGLNDDELKIMVDLSLGLLGPLEVIGNDDENDILGAAGDDVLTGGAATDFLIGNEGADQMDGGDGMDIALYAFADAGVWADLLNPAINRGEAAGDTFTSVEVLFGSRFADRLYGDDAEASTESFGNLLVGGKGNDRLYGRGGDDVLAGGQGRDVLNGGDGSDWTMYFDAETDGVTVNLTDSLLNTGIALGDTFVSIENVAGSDHGDHITGTNIANQLHGEDGNDLLFGLGGNDVLYGGYGSDTLNGSSGGDTYVYESRFEGGDTITAFDSQDRIELRIDTSMGPGDVSDWSDLDFDVVTGALLNPSQQFLVNTAATGTAPVFLYNTTTKALSFDIDGVGGQLAVQLFQVTGAANVSASDIKIVIGDFGGF